MRIIVFFIAFGLLFTAAAGCSLDPSFIGINRTPATFTPTPTVSIPTQTATPFQPLPTQTPVDTLPPTSEPTSIPEPTSTPEPTAAPEPAQARVEISQASIPFRLVQVGDDGRLPDDLVWLEGSTERLFRIGEIGLVPTTGEEEPVSNGVLPSEIGQILADQWFPGSANPGRTDVAGYHYHGMAFPSLHDRYIFAIWSDDGKSPSNRLFIASPYKHDDQRWNVEELAFTDRPYARLDGLIQGIGIDSAGEIYLMVSSDADLAQSTSSEHTASLGSITAPDYQNSQVYKLAPHVSYERSTISDPGEFLPLTFRYARLVRNAPIYKNLDDVRANEPYDTHGGGNYWVSERRVAQVNGRTYYYVSWGWGRAAWIAGSDVRFDAPLSRLQGVNLKLRAGEPLAMAFNPVFVRSIPGLIIDETIVGALQKHDVVRVLESRQVDGNTWYRIGPDQWSHGGYLKVFVPNSRPDGVGPDEKWVEINLAEQVLIAYEGDTPVFATLVATGRRNFETEKGLYRVWSKVREGPMQWEDSTTPYSLANVPYIMYFNQGQGLHAAYWHDAFGTVRSAGCVNLSPHDAHWLFHWAGPELPEGQRILYPTQEDPGIWVWVHDNRPDLDRLIYEYMLNNGEWPVEMSLLP
jgi:hypothetical protein